MSEVLEPDDLYIQPIAKRDRAFRQTIVIAFAARSGSTALCSGLASAELAEEIIEVFNPRGPLENSLQRFGGDDVGDYLDKVHKGTMYSDTLLLKTIHSDFAPVLAHHDVNELLPNCRVVYLSRQDKLLQAISVFRAMSSGVWHRASGQNTNTVATPTTFEKAEWSGDLTQQEIQKVLSLRQELVEEAVKWEDYFERNAIFPIRVLYEDFDADPQAVLSELYREIFGKRYDGNFNVGFSRLRDDYSARWARQIRESCPEQV